MKKIIVFSVIALLLGAGAFVYLNILRGDSSDFQISTVPPVSTSSDETPEDYNDATVDNLDNKRTAGLETYGRGIPEGWLEYTDTRYGFSINYPKDLKMDGGDTLRGLRDCPLPPDYEPEPFPAKFDDPTKLQNEICNWYVSGLGDGPMYTIVAWTNRADFDAEAYPAQYPNVQKYLTTESLEINGVPATLRQIDWSSVPDANGNNLIQVVIGDAPTFVIGTNMGGSEQFEDFYSSFRFIDHP